MATAKEIETQAPAEPLAENTVVDETASLAVRRYFTIPGRDPFDEIDWEIRDAFIPGKEKPVFDQKDVEFPKFWSQTATNIVAQKYFRGRMTSPERERRSRSARRANPTTHSFQPPTGWFQSESSSTTTRLGARSTTRAVLHVSSQRHTTAGSRSTGSVSATAVLSRRHLTT